MMDVAVPANMQHGLAQEEIARKGWALDAGERDGAGRPARRRAVDLRETTRARASTAASRARCTRPIRDLQDNIGPGGMLHELARATGKRIVFYCAFGERSAMAVQAAQDAGIVSALPHPRRPRRLAQGRRSARALISRARLARIARCR